MIQFTGALIRALVMSIVVIAPAYILPDIPYVARELSLIIAVIIAAFVLFEYAGKSPGFVDFRFAPPYNRFRVGILAALSVSLSIICRASLTGNSGVLSMADRAIPIAITPNSPSEFALRMIAEFETSTSVTLLTQIFSAAFVVGVALTIVMSLLLLLFKWPFGRSEFNLWVNLPTFAPAEIGLTGRRLKRDGWFNILIAFGLYYVTPYSFPIIQARLGPDLFGNTHSLVWIATVWAFLPSLAFIRGISLLKIAAILSKASTPR